MAGSSRAVKILQTFVVSFADASVIVYNTRTGEEVIGMASLETYNGTPSTVANAVAATTIGLNSTLSFDPSRSVSGDKSVTYGATCSSTRFTTPSSPLVTISAPNELLFPVKMTDRTLSEWP